MLEPLALAIGLGTVKVAPSLARRADASCDASRRAAAESRLPRPLCCNAMETTTSPALSVAIAVLAVLLGLTGFGVYTAFGPPSKTLSDPFDDHDD